jgi:hypothetical protein
LPLIDGADGADGGAANASALPRDGAAGLEPMLAAGAPPAVMGGCASFGFERRPFGDRPVLLNFVMVRFPGLVTKKRTEAKPSRAILADQRLFLCGLPRLSPGYNCRCLLKPRKDWLKAKA